jgi:hypothetical protein
METNMTAKILIATAAILAATTGTASAHSVRPIDRAMNEQAYKIEQGRRSGRITWREGHKLRAEQRKIARLRNVYLSDGMLTRREFRTLRRKQKAAALHIVSEKFDGHRRLKFLPRVGR